MSVLTPPKSFRKYGYLVALLALQGVTSLWAEGDLTTSDGQSFKGVKVLSDDAEKVKIMHMDGISSVRKALLPPEFLQKHGLAPAGAPAAPAPMAPQELPPAAPAAQTSDVQMAVGNPMDYVMIIQQGPDAGGSGVLVTEKGRTYLYTVMHVLVAQGARFYNAKGEEVKIPEMTQVELSNDPAVADVARVPLSSSIQTPLVLSDEMNVGQDIVAYGNSLAGNVVTSLEGSIVGVGPSQVEIDAEVVQGNSGGPIMIPGTNKVIGLVEMAKPGKNNYVAAGTRFSEARRFAIRPTRVSKWLPMTLHGLRQQNARIETINNDSIILDCLALVEPFRGSFVPVARPEVAEVFKAGAATQFGQSVNAAIATLNRSLGASGSTTQSIVQVKQHYAKFYSTIFQLAKTNVAGVQPSEYVPHLRPNFVEAAEQRKAIVTKLLERAAAIQNFQGR